MLDTRQEGLLRALIYPVQFDSRPEEAVDRVMKTVVEQNALDASEHEYLAAIEAALEGDDRLSELLPQQHGEAAIRSYLSQLQRQLVGKFR